MLWFCIGQFYQNFHGLFLLHWNNHMVVDVIYVAQPWRTKVNRSHKFLKTDCITTTKQRRLWIFHVALVANNSLTVVKYGPVITHPDSKVHGANMVPIWVLSAPGGAHVGPIDLAFRALYYLCNTQQYHTAHPHGYVWYVFYQCKLFSISSLHSCCAICCAILH